ncbi:serine/threonine protein kinase [Phytophthora nicotianae P10297]|uniref:Serine/threonine protein kinase n=3 Tax=Phytophthora nicotianae TaxID=4792 RepID=W2ZCH9_PHYNI|nr:serine/threonine protein kinase [Phytophthora nicotianae]ETO75941.1 serine/threonine protein kinase [Phytophthora nicotianae P1976]ETP45062.1 serine/threonine protein kinase [Phytophthora nicotianae P10297]
MDTYKGSLCLVKYVLLYQLKAIEYCSRGPLRDVLRANLIEWHTKVRLAFEAAKGLALLHSREPTYLHRDLKAPNILVTTDMTAKITDFGIARIATGFTSIAESVVIVDNAASEVMTTFAGTWRWNAPEIMKNPNECRFNRETDMCSFGVVQWGILTNGAAPFRAPEEL